MELVLSKKIKTRLFLDGDCFWREQYEYFKTFGGNIICIHGFDFRRGKVPQPHLRLC